MTQKSHLSRRTVLRGLGTAMALPLLEAMAPAVAPVFGAGTSTNVAAGTATAPVRMAYIYVPNGVHLPSWTPRSQGSEFDLPYILEPLQAVRENLLVLTGLTQDKGRANGDGAGDHARAASAFLTGTQPVKTPGANIRLAISVDQLAAQQLGTETRLPSLELGVEPGSNSGNCDSGYSCAYSNNISWTSPTTPTAKEIDPRLVFERLFVDELQERDATKARERRLRQRKSILDFVLEESRRLNRRLGATDQRKIDEYFTNVRGIERRLERANAAGGLANVQEPENLPAKARERIAYEDHVRLLCDMVVLAFQGDITRVTTFMFSREGSNRSYREVDVADGHHTLSHHQRDPIKLEKISRINRFHVTQFAYLLERLKSIKEGDGTLLDNCMILYGSGISDGNRHNNENLPVLLAGSGGGSIDSGRHVKYEFETPMCNLFLSMLDRAGVPVDTFGDSTERLRGLTT